MRIIIISDTHNNFSKLKQVVEKNEDADLFIHLGDGEKELDEIKTIYQSKKFLFVRGNCDFASQEKSVDFFFVRDTKIIFTHGHLYDVKYNIDKFKQAVKETGSTIGLFGHTHNAISIYEDGVYLLNPGSLGAPRDSSPTYGIIDIIYKDINPQIVAFIAKIQL